NSTPSSNQFQCMAQLIGYSCCAPDNTNVYDHDKIYGDWGYDFIKNEWCGITPYTKQETKECWSEKLGYPCCKSCTIYTKDKDGSWGYESNNWCGI
ncbi:Non-catalytic module family DOC2, partial [Piromyces sp. E2]